MIIQILSNLYDQGYLQKETSAFISPFFSGANVAFRRDIFNQIGLYDENCATGEDCDICIRTAKAGWELYFQPKALVRHKNAGSLGGFIRKWFYYGFYHPYLFKKYNSRCLEIYRAAGRKRRGIIYRCIYRREHFPFHALIFVTPFLSFHVFVLFAVLSVIAGLEMLPAVFGLAALIIAVFYFKSDIKTGQPLRSVMFIALRYLANLALLVGGFLGGLRLGILHVNATLDYKA